MSYSKKKYAEAKSGTKIFGALQEFLRSEGSTTREVVERIGHSKLCIGFIRDTLFNMHGYDIKVVGTRTEIVKGKPRKNWVYKVTCRYAFDGSIEKDYASESS